MPVERLTRRTMEVVEGVQELLYENGIYMPKNKLIEYIILHYAYDALKRIIEERPPTTTPQGWPPSLSLRSGGGRGGSYG